MESVNPTLAQLTLSYIAMNAEKLKSAKLKSAETVHVAEIDANGLLFEARDGFERQYAWGNYETSEVTGPARLVRAWDDWGLSGGTWCVFYLEDCAFPPLYAVRARTFEEAYEIFVDWHAENAHGLKIEDSEMKDYDAESLNFTSNGIPVDTECVRGFEVRLIEVKC